MDSDLDRATHRRGGDLPYIEEMYLGATIQKMQAHHEACSRYWDWVAQEIHKLNKEVRQSAKH